MCSRCYLNTSTTQSYTHDIVGGDFMHLNRSSSTAMSLNVDGVTDQSFSKTAEGIVDGNFQAFKYATIYHDSTIGCGWAGGDLLAERADFYTAWNNYLTSL